MAQGGTRPTTIILVALLAVGVGIMALRPGSVEVSVDDVPPVTPPADGTAVVADSRGPGGLNLFGIQIIDPTHTVDVVFLTGPGCSALLLSGDPWPAPYPSCASDVDVSGSVGGLGVTEDGRSLVGVTVTVSRACFERVERGMVWPPDLAECPG